MRNNITTEEHPLGVYHPHAELHHIKKENIGLIEVMGLAVLPSRLKVELADLGKAILENKDISQIDNLKSHGPWLEEIKAKYQDLSETNIDEVLKTETGLVFSKVLQDAGVYKNLEDFNRFIDIL